MSTRVAAQIGSGTLPYTYGILSPEQRGNQEGAGGVRVGTQVVVANPEELSAQPAFASSGVVVGTSEVEILSPETNPLPRATKVVIQNVTDTRTVRISHRLGNVLLQGYSLESDGVIGSERRIEIPLMTNSRIYARANAANCQLRLLIY